MYRYRQKQKNKSIGKALKKLFFSKLKILTTFTTYSRPQFASLREPTSLRYTRVKTGQFRHVSSHNHEVSSRSRTVTFPVGGGAWAKGTRNRVLHGPAEVCQPSALDRRGNIVIKFSI